MGRLNSVVRLAMTLPSALTDFSAWIEAHATTVDLLKWILVGLLAWTLGVFRFLRAKLKRPKLEIESFTSRCIWQEIGVVDGNDHNARVVFLIESGITNPTTDPLVVRDFTLKVKRLKSWPVRNHPLNAVTLPSRVRNSIGEITKLLKNWFSNFSEGSESLTLNGRIEARDHQSGFLLFVSVSWGYLRPLEKNGAIPVKLSARLTTGERLVARSNIILMDDHSAFEAMVPGILEHVENRSTWNIIRAQA
ncbi:hypothetical protein RMA73_10050 [Xanthomonas translucens pv. translucens]|uniref:hypothetical protein n=2 Tax=Xanthomonas campestris pv. translucens TaxID=343 RepID=UPI0012D95BD3|nr:hypothetical protein [Xanthomonas translucens]WNJ28858.1 hypothetical protein RMA73_10050 [Xanthomonas translucens pv. translucens]